MATGNKPVAIDQANGRAYKHTCGHVMPYRANLNRLTSVEIVSWPDGSIEFPTRFHCVTLTLVLQSIKGAIKGNIDGKIALAL